MQSTMLFTYNNLDLTIKLFKKCAQFLRDPSGDDTRVGKYLESLGNLMDNAYELVYGLGVGRKIPKPIIEIHDETMREHIHVRATVLGNKLIGDGMYGVNSHKLPTSIKMLVTEDLPLWPRITTQLILTKLTGTENVYVVNELDRIFFKNNQRFRYPWFEIKPAFLGSERRQIHVKGYNMNPDVLAFDVSIKFVFNYRTTVETFQGFLE